MTVLTFDGAVLAARPWTGVQRSFLTTLAAYAKVARGRCVLLLPAEVDPPRLANVDVHPGPVGWRRRQTELPGLLRRLGAALLHCPVAAVPWRAPCPVIATIHDLPWIATPRLREAGSGWRHRWAARLALRQATTVVVPTAATAADVARWLGPKALHRVHVVAHGVELPPQPAPAEDLTGDFLVLGDDRPRKNLARVRAAHARAQRAAAALPALAFVGPGFGYVEEPQKIALLRRARALLHLAVHEGFGLPVVEAFAHGVPVVAADIAALREVAGGAALLVDPTDEAAIATALVRIDRDLALRTELRRLGLARAQQLTPAQTAQRWLDLHATLHG